MALCARDNCKRRCSQHINMTDQFFDDVDLDDDLPNDERAKRPASTRQHANKHKSQYRRLTESQKWSYVVVSLLLMASIVSNSMSIWGTWKGKSIYDDVGSRANVRKETIQNGKKLESQCFQCTLGTQQPDGGITPGNTYTTIVKSKMELTEDAAKMVHFPDGIQVPGIIFGKTLQGFSEKPNTPVIFTRGTLYANPTSGVSLQGNAGYTSIAHIFASETPVSERCKSLLSPSDSGGQTLIDRVPHYILVDDTGSTPDFYYCTCTTNVDSAITTAADGEYCTQFDTTI